MPAPSIIHAFKSLLLGTCAAIATIALPYVLAMVVPTSVLIYDEGGPPPPKSSLEKPQTMQDLEKATRDAEERLRRQDKTPPQLNQISWTVRNSFWWCSWLPWLLLPFLTRINPRSANALLAVAPLAIFAVLRWVLPMEAILSVVFLFIGIALRSRRPKEPGPEF